MSALVTVDQFQKMKTHELADLLANLVLLLRRLPNVEWQQLAPGTSGESVPAQRELAPVPLVPLQKPSSDGKFPISEPSLAPKATWTIADIEGKKVTELRQMAKDLNLHIPSKSVKDEIIAKLRDRLSRDHSEQYNIQTM